jgi:predicted nucleic acid-binding Zn ribbon protein
MLKIQCPECNKSFLWTDDMPATGKCPIPDCNGRYDIHSELKRNISRRGTAVEQKTTLHCPFCSGIISSGFTICPHCSRIVAGTRAFRKSYFFLAVCIILILLYLVFKYLVN